VARGGSIRYGDQQQLAIAHDYIGIREVLDRQHKDVSVAAVPFGFNLTLASDCSRHCYPTMAWSSSRTIT
jgi:hypothetical protein